MKVNRPEAVTSGRNTKASRRKGHRRGTPSTVHLEPSSKELSVKSNSGHNTTCINMANKENQGRFEFMDETPPGYKWIIRPWIRDRRTGKIRRPRNARFFRFLVKK